ncbi:hypothetical protein ACEUD4_02180 [Aeromonas media]|uniref:hypothetical protein n=1 Tax=Aeromonas media TaxID=651 RepID=UPI0038CF8FB5
MTDILQSAKYCVSNAQRHMGTLDSELHSFFGTKPFRRVIEFDHRGPADIHKLKLINQFPDMLSGIAFDAISNLRAALDQAAYAVAKAAGGAGKNAYFPFGDTEAEAASRKTGGSREIPDSVFSAMLSSKPYREGNVFLWGLNRLCNYNKHRFIVPTAIYTGGGHLRHAHFTSFHEFYFPPRWDNVKQEMIIAVLPHRAPFTMDMQIQTYVSFADVAGLPMSDCSYVLEQCTQAVQNALMNIETECKALGLQK